MQDSTPLSASFHSGSDHGHEGTVSIVMPYCQQRAVVGKQDTGMTRGITGDMMFSHDNKVAQGSQTGLTV